MCLKKTSKVSPICYPLNFSIRQQKQSKRLNFQVYRLMKRRNMRRFSEEAKQKASAGAWKREMEMKNLKLYMKNQTIIHENEKLKEKAMLLHQENRALLSQLQKISHPHNNLPHNKY